MKLYFKRDIRLLFGIQKTLVILVCMILYRFYYEKQLSPLFLCSVSCNLFSSLIILLLQGRCFFYNSILHLFSLIFNYFSNEPILVLIMMLTNDIFNILLITLSQLYFSILIIRENSSKFYRFLANRTLSPSIE